MKFAFTTILLAPRFGWQPRPPADERLRMYACVADAGFDGIEWSPRWCDYDGLGDTKIGCWADEVIGSGLNVSAINLNRVILTRTDQAAENMRRIDGAIRAAGPLRCDNVNLSLSMPTPPDSRRDRLKGSDVSCDESERTIESLHQLADVAQEHGVTLTLELHDDGLLDTAQLCIETLSRLARTNVGVNPDLGNLIRNEPFHGNWRAALNLLAPKMTLWHLKNYRSGRPTAIWDGDIDYRGAITTVRDVGFDGWCSIESYFGDDVMRLQRESLAWIQSLSLRETTA